MSKLLFLLVLNFVAAMIEQKEESQSLTNTPTVSSTKEIPSSQTNSTPFTQEGQQQPPPAVLPLKKEEIYLYTEYDAELLREHHLQVPDLLVDTIGNIIICAKVSFIYTKPTDDDNCGCAFHAAKRDVKQCNMKVKPIVRKLTAKDSDSDVSCGPEEKEGSMYSFGYKACEINAPSPLSQQVQENSDFFEVYKFCHSKKDEKVIYTEHIIHNAKYLIPPVLKTQQKQDAKYNMITDGYTYFGSYYADIAKEYKKLNALFKWKVDKSFPTEDIISTNFPAQLVPVDDMAFTLTRRPTFHYLNAAPMKFGYITYWNYLSYLIREDAKINERLFSINTGAFIVDPSEKKGPIKVDIEGIDIKEVDIEEVDVWIKMIRYEEKNLTSASTSKEKKKGEMKSFAIVMNTGLNDERFKTFNEDLCENNLCDQASVMFKQYGPTGGSVRCCPTKKIAEKFFDKKVGTETSFIINGLTKQSHEKEFTFFVLNLYIPTLK